MNVEYCKWWSPNLSQDMELKVYGHAGKPFVVFPAQGGRFYEYEDFGMVEACRPSIDAGRVTLVTIDSIDNQSWCNWSIPPGDRGRRHNDYDRYVVELPPADAEWRPLADPETLAETAAWLWEFGPTPLIAVIGADGAAPSWLDAWTPRPMKATPAGPGYAAVIATQSDLERFLAEGAPHEHTVLLWPRVSPAKTFEALAAGGDAWTRAVDAHATIARNGERFEINQVA